MGSRSRPKAFSRSADDRATFFRSFFGRSKKGTPGIYKRPDTPVVWWICIDDKHLAVIGFMFCHFTTSDKWCRGRPVFDALYDLGVVLVRPSDDPQTGHNRISQMRQRVESTFSSLWRRIVDRVYARSWPGLWTTLLLKMLDYNLALARRAHASI